MDATDNIATDLFYKVRSRFTGLKLGNGSGEITINPEDARFFDFDYVEEDKTIGHMSISLAEPNSMKVYFSNGITEGMNDTQKDNWYKFLRELRGFAKRRLLAFDTRDIAKDNLDTRDYAFLSQYAVPKQTNDTITKPVGENVMNESNLYGTKTQSFQKLLDTRLIIKHSKTLADDHEQRPGDRARNISALFVENQEGERFKYPFIHLAGARAMQRHVANGGLPYDEIGKSIIGMSEEIAQLKSFTNYCVRNDLMNSDTNSLVERSQEQLQNLRDSIAKLSKQTHYEAYKETFQTPEAMEVPDDVMEQLKEKFTVKSFKEDLTSVFPVLYKLMKEEETVGYDDIVEMTGNKVNEGGNAWDMAVTDAEGEVLDSGSDEEAIQRLEKLKYGDDAEPDELFANKVIDDMIEKVKEMGLDKVQHELDMRESSDDYFKKFEDWATGLGEDSPIQSSDDEERSQAIRELQELVGNEFPAGTDGVNAIESLKGIIEDPRLEKDIKDYAKEDSNSDVRPLVKAWIEENAPESIDELDFGDMSNESAVGADDIEPQQEASGYEGQSEPQKHHIRVSGDFDPEKGISEKDAKEIQDSLESQGINASVEPSEMDYASVIIHTMKSKETIMDALEKSGYDLDESAMSEEQINEFWGAIGRAAFSGLSKLGNVLKGGAGKLKEPAKDALKKIPDIAKGGTSIAGKGVNIAGKGIAGVGNVVAKNPGTALAVGGGAYMANKVGDAVDYVKGAGDKVWNSVDQAKNEITDMVGDAVDGFSLSNIADLAVKYALPAGMVIAALYGGKKILDWVFDDYQNDETPVEGNEFAKKVQDLKSQGAKKGTKFKTSDGEEHTLEDVAKFIHSFYDRNTGTFPKGPEGVCTMVDKKFGEQAGTIARKMVERMAPAQERGAEEIEELSRIKQLAGM